MKVTVDGSVSHCVVLLTTESYFYLHQNLYLEATEGTSPNMFSQWK